MPNQPKNPPQGATLPPTFTVTVLGTRYAGGDAVDAGADATADPPPHIARALHHAASLPWLTYRRDFPPVEGLTSDVGWGCTLRSGQMLLAAALVRAAVGREWRRPRDGDDAPLPPSVDALLALFADTEAAPLGLHALMAAGSRHGVVAGRWIGPSAFCGAAAAALATARAARPDATPTLPSVTVLDGGGGAPTLWRGAAPPAAWPALVLVPLTLGPSRSLTPAYAPPLVSALALPQSAGALGGRPGASLFFVGVAGSGGGGGDGDGGPPPPPPALLLLLDPHDARPATAPLAHWCDAPRVLRLDGVDPSLALAFWCVGADDWTALCDGLASIEAAHPGAPLVSVREGDGAAAAAADAAAVAAVAGGECEDGFELL